MTMLTVLFVDEKTPTTASLSPATNGLIYNGHGYIKEGSACMYKAETYATVEIATKAYMCKPVGYPDYSEDTVFLNKKGHDLFPQLPVGTPMRRDVDQHDVYKCGTAGSKAYLTDLVPECQFWLCSFTMVDRKDPSLKAHGPYLMSNIVEVGYDGLHSSSRCRGDLGHISGHGKMSICINCFTQPIDAYTDEQLIAMSNEFIATHHEYIGTVTKVHYPQRDNA